MFILLKKHSFVILEKKLKLVFQQFSKIFYRFSSIILIQT